MTVNDYQRQAMRTLNPALGKKDVLINSMKRSPSCGAEAARMSAREQKQG